MIATCPGCQTRYRLAPEKVGPKGARIRCSRCENVFKVVRDPDAPAAAPPVPEPPAAKPAPQKTAPQKAAPRKTERPTPTPAPAPMARALVAETDARTAKAIGAFLETWQIASDFVGDGAEALLRLHRKPPDVAVLGAGLPGVSAPVIVELLRRHSELGSLPVIRVAAPTEQPTAAEFEANDVLEPEDLPEGLAQALEAIGVGARPTRTGRPVVPPSSAPQTPPAPRAAPQPEAAPEPPAAPRRARRAPPPTSSDPEVASAERLARIIVSDIILYSPEKFDAAIAAGNVAEALDSDLDEGRSLFQQRIDPRVRDERNFLVEELIRVARERGMQ